MGSNCQGVCKSKFDQQQYKQQKEIKQADNFYQQNQILKTLKNIPVDKIKKLRVEVNEFPTPPANIQSKIQKLSLFLKSINSSSQSQTQNPNVIKKKKIYRYKTPYNFFFMNLQQQQDDQNIQLPKGKCIIYKLKQNNQFGGYFQGTLKDYLEFDIQGSLIIFPNGSYFQGKPLNRGLYMNQNTGLNYEGQWKNQMPHHQGKQKNNKGVYEGQYKKGQKYGKGKFVWNDNSSYEGQFQKGVFHGIGRLKDLNQNYQYNGQFFNGQKHGKAVEINKKLKYQGQFKYGLKYGHGILQFYQDQQLSRLQKIYQGDFSVNQPHGKGILSIYKNGNIQQKLKGLWTQGNLTSIFSYQ